MIAPDGNRWTGIIYSLRIGGGREDFKNSKEVKLNWGKKGRIEGVVV
jgi:hypothetical protein